MNTNDSLSFSEKLVKYMALDRSKNILALTGSSKNDKNLTNVRLTTIWTDCPNCDTFLLLNSLNIKLKIFLSENSEAIDSKSLEVIEEVSRIFNLLQMSPSSNFLFTPPLINLMKDQNNFGVLIKIFNKILEIRNKFFVEKINRKSVFAFIEHSLSKKDNHDETPLPAQFSKLDLYDKIADLLKIHNVLIQIMPKQEKSSKSFYIFHNNFLLLLLQLVKVVKGVSEQSQFMTLTQSFFQLIDNMDQMNFEFSEDLRNQMSL